MDREGEQAAKEAKKKDKTAKEEAEEVAVTNAEPKAGVDATAQKKGEEKKEEEEVDLGNFDDYSDEEDTKAKANEFHHWNTVIQPDLGVADVMQKNATFLLANTKSEKVQSNNPNYKDDAEYSFITHEFGLRLLNSGKVNNEYYE